MKHKLLTLFLLCFIGKIFASEPSVFLNSLDEVKQKAIKEHKGIFVLYYADWCGFCKKFQEETLTNPEVKETLNAGFVSYRVLNSSEEGAAYKAAFYIKSLPTLLFFDENGDIKTMSSGFQSTEEFVKLLKNVYKSYYQKPFPNEKTKLQLLQSKLEFKNPTIEKELTINYAKQAVCNDNNACTDDTEDRNGGCIFTPNNNNTCSDNSLCTTGDHCSNGVCIGTPITCPDDGNICTTASCNPLTGCFQVNNNNNCDDNNPCTINDRCTNGICAGIPRSCNDNNPCTTDICNAVTGACEYINNSANCNDNNACTLNDFCVNGVCQPGLTPRVCNDNNPCTDDTCDPLTGCKFTPKAGGSSCNDNNVCTINDVCLNGNCTGTQISCPDDGNTCTTASCNPLTGCFQVNNNNSCDDNNPCTINDVCSNGICAGTPKSCDDGNPCTTDFCNTTTGACEHVNNSSTCTDNNVCTLNDVCNNGICQPGTTQRVCDDNNPCTDDTCDPLTGCKFTPKAGGSGCNDNNVCTINDVCVNGNCTGTQISCPDDGNACTTASCNPLTGCFQVNNNNTCDDNNPCTINDVCSNGVCAGTPKSCDDGNPCTTDFCNATTGACEHINNSSTCTDNNVCTLNDVCNNGICQPGTTQLVCDDNNPCTDDTCDPLTGCKFTPKAGGSGCNDNNVCTINDVCVNGNCTGTQISCPDDGNACTTASCNPLTGCFQVNNNNTCDDNNPCTINDACSNGICAGTPKSCDDGNPCTTDICNVTTGACEHINNTNSCNDGNNCTSNDSCSDGICLGTPVVCNDNNPCTNDECHPAFGCVFTPITNSLQISGLNYFQNTISGNVTKGAINNLFTVLNTVPPTDPNYILTKIGIGANVGFFAGNSVTLNPGFQVPSGAVFKAEIKTCN